mmetsp:Transcript_30767/g.70406  ORF Transcript_30767/g.70406 Transcript_30767/m.70406 type:complete len:271 (-) Transcript_30767:84-896(-)
MLPSALSIFRCTNKYIVPTVCIDSQILIEIYGIKPPFPQGGKLVRSPVCQIQRGPRKLKVRPQSQIVVRRQRPDDAERSAAPKGDVVDEPSLRRFAVTVVGDGLGDVVADVPVEEKVDLLLGRPLEEPFLAKQGAARRVGVRTQGGEIRDDVLDLRSIRGSSRRSDEGKKAVLQPFPGRVCLINGIGKGNDVGPKFGDGTHDVRKEVVGSRPETRRTCVRRFWEGGKGNEGLHRPNHRCGYPKNRCRKHLRHDLTSRSAYFGWSADHIRL